MEQIKATIEAELRRFGGRGGAMPRIVAAWPSVVGSEVARHAWPARIARDGTLHVHTSSSVWAFELAQLAAAIKERLDAALAGDSPRALRFAPGHLPESGPAPADAPAAPGEPPSSRAATESARLAAPIRDRELRERVARAVALGLDRARSGRCVW